MNKIYKKNNYIIITGPDIISEFPITNIYVDKHELTDEYYIYFNSVTSKCVAIVSVPNILKENNTPYTQEEWETFYTVNTGFFFNVGGGGGDTGAIPADQFVDVYSDLPDPTTVIYQIWIVKNAEGTSWLPGSLGGTYYPEGGYASDGIKWIYHKDSYQASQLEVDFGTITNKWITPFTFENAAKWLDKYDATNPSGYQTAVDVTTAIYDKIKDELYDSSWTADNSGATRNVLYDKFELTSSEIAGKQPLSAVLTATTASFTTADETKLDGIATGATANSSDATLLARANHTGTQLSGTISDFNSATRAQTEAELVAGANITITPSGTGATRQLTIASTGGSSTQSAFTVLANNTSSTATPTEQVFKCVAEQNYAGAGTITWGTSAPTTILANTYRWQQLGKFVTAQFNFSYNTAATNSQVTFTLPTDMPTPQTVSGFTGALDIICYGIGGMFSSTTAFPTTARVSFLRRNSANTGYEFLIVQSAGSSIKTAQLTITYEAL